MLTKFTCIKHENNTNITQSQGRYIFVTYLQEIFGVLAGIHPYGNCDHGWMTVPCCDC